MKAFYAFSDECGSYQQTRTEKFIKAHPFYVRATVILNIDDYAALDDYVVSLKQKLSIDRSIEIKWSELGKRFKGQASDACASITGDTLKTYFNSIIEFASKLISFRVIFTVFDNSSDYVARDAVMIKMHIQNALQRVQHEMIDHNGYALMIIDDIGEQKNRVLKDACHQLMLNGDFVNYSNIRKSILVDYSHHCPGLQLADICAGLFTSCLKRIQLGKGNNYEFSYALLLSTLYKNVRCNMNHWPDYATYRYGIKEVPTDCGVDTCRKIAHLIDVALYTDCVHEIFE